MEAVIPATSTTEDVSAKGVTVLLLVTWKPRKIVFEKLQAHSWGLINARSLFLTFQDRG